MVTWPTEQHCCALPRRNLSGEGFGEALRVRFKHAREGAALEEHGPLLRACARDEHELVVTPGALSKRLAWRDAAQSSHDAHMVLTTSVFSSFPPLEHVAGSASLPVLKKYSSTRSQKQRTISLRQPALTVKSHY